MGGRGGLLVRLGVGVLVGLDAGGCACLQHVMLRLWLIRNDAAPWCYVDFLDYATERIFSHSIAFRGNALSPS